MAMPGLRERDAWLFVLPFLLVFAVFTLWPLLLNVWLAFHDYFILSGNMAWNGFANFVYLAEDELYFYPAVNNTLIFLLVVPPLQIAALLLAILASGPNMGVFRVIFYIPVIIAVSLAGVVWQQVLKADGLLNGLLALLSGLAIEKMPDWLNEPRYALFAVMLFFCWKHLGYYMVLYLAGLQQQPQAQLEAAKMDGANRWQILIYITLPALQPIILLSTLLSTISALKTLQEVVVMTGGQSDSTTLQLYIYGAALYGQSFGVAAAAALILMSLCLGLAYLQWQVFGEKGLMRRGG
jgi:putative chitobiose transport system permease protein